MATELKLKKIEQSAMRSTYQDGLLEICISSIIGSMAFMMFIPVRDDDSWIYQVLAFLGVGTGQLIYWAGKRFITLPRLGQVKFGELRRKRSKTMGIILALAVIIQVGIVLLTVGVWAIPTWAEKLEQLFPERSTTDMIVAALGALFVGPSMMAIAYFTDFSRGYYISIVMALGVFFMIWFWQPLIQVSAAILILVPGLVSFLRFLRKYPIVSK